MIGILARGAAATALLAASAAQATVITYNFSVPATTYSDSLGTAGNPGTFTGSMSIDTVKLAAGNISIVQPPASPGSYGHAQFGSQTPANQPVVETGTVAGTPMDTLLNAGMYSTPQTFQSSYNQEFYNPNAPAGTNTYFLFDIVEQFDQTSYPGSGGFIRDGESRVFELAFYNADPMSVDGYVLPTPGSGTIRAYLYHTVTHSVFNAAYQYVAGASSQKTASIIGYGMTTDGASGAGGPAGAVPEPGALGLLGLGIGAVALRRGRAGA